MTRVRTVVLIFILVFAALALSHFLARPSAASLSPTLIFEDGFEGNTSANWAFVDSDNASGSDFWGVSSVRPHNGTKSLWCAENGTNSQNGTQNSAVSCFDSNMGAKANLSVGNISGYDSAFVGFYYWAATDAASQSTFSAYYYVPGAANSMKAWEVAAPNTSGWAHAEFPIPTNATSLEFRFHSGAAPEAREGVYLDDVYIEGNDTIAPYSSLEGLHPYFNTMSFDIPCEFGDGGGSGVSKVELYYTSDGGAHWRLYGNYTSSPICFTAPSDNKYDFYTVAVDRAGNMETAPTSGYAETIIDIEPPSLQLIAPTGGWVNTSDVLAQWAGSDRVSKIQKYEVQLAPGDSAPQIQTAWIDAGTATNHLFSSLDNDTYIIRVRAYDRAGNLRTNSTSFVVDMSPPRIDVISPANNSEVAIQAASLTWGGVAGYMDSSIHHYEISIDGMPSADVGTRTNYSLQGLSPGKHTATIKAVDKANNEYNTTITFYMGSSQAQIYPSDVNASASGKQSGSPVQLEVAMIIIFLGILLWQVWMRVSRALRKK